MTIGSVLLMLPIASHPGQARDSDGRYANSAAEAMVRQSEERQGPVLFRTRTAAPSATWIGNRKADTTAFASTASGLDVPDDAVITEPNRAGRTMVWPIRGYQGMTIRCFMPGSMT